MFSGIISGWIIDKFSRLAIIRIVIVLMSTYLFFWACYMYFFTPNIISIYLFTFFSGILMSIDIASRSTYMTSLLKKSLMKKGIILNVIFLNLAWFIGPNIGMFLLDIFNFAVLYFFLSLIDGQHIYSHYHKLKFLHHLNYKILKRHYYDHLY